MKVILGHKVGMTQLWAANGRLISGTVILAKENSVVTKGESQTTIGVATTGKTNQPQQKIAGTLGSKRGIWLKSLPVKIESDTLTVDQFEVGEKVSVTGITKGKGFAGGVKRHGFHGWPASHGHSHQRRPGSIGAQRPQRVVKGQKMAGHMGAEQFTSRGSTVLFVDASNDTIIVSGAVPGPKKGRVFLKSQVNNVKEQ
ncbi:MAG: 50S ribosomal protein L3 [Patescibacteria group bacterium]